MSNFKQLEMVCPECRRPINKRTSFCLDCGDYVEPLFMDPRFKTRRRARGFRGADMLKVAILVSGFALFCIFVITAYETIKSVQASGETAIKKARAYILSGEDESAINLLSRAMEEDRSGKFHGQMLALLDQCLYERGLKLAQSGHYQDAVTCFARVSAAYQNKSEVDKLIDEYSDKALPVEFAQVTGLAAAKKMNGGAALSAIDKAMLGSVTRPREAAPVKKAVMPQTAPSVIEVEPPVAPPIKSKVVSDSQVSDIAHYNSLLSGYFSRGGGSGAEPPSYQEWLSSGKAEF